MRHLRSALHSLRLQLLYRNNAWSPEVPHSLQFLSLAHHLFRNCQNPLCQLCKHLNTVRLHLMLPVQYSRLLQRLCIALFSLLILHHQLHTLSRLLVHYKSMKSHYTYSPTKGSPVHPEKYRMYLCLHYQHGNELFANSDNDYNAYYNQENLLKMCSYRDENGIRVSFRLHLHMQTISCHKSWNRVCHQCSFLPHSNLIYRLQSHIYADTGSN